MNPECLKNKTHSNSLKQMLVKENPKSQINQSKKKKKDAKRFISIVDFGLNHTGIFELFAIKSPKYLE